MSSRGIAVALLLVLAGGWATAQAFVLSSSRWPTPEATFFAGFVFSSGRSPSSVTWNQAFREAAQRWNASTAFQYGVNDERSDPCAGVLPNVPEDGFRNGTGFAPDDCGIPFGSTTLAVTTTYFQNTTTTETDIVFNSNEPWDVYSGPWQSSVSDFRRVAAHELGHALGLEHETRFAALMEPVVVPGSTVEGPLSDDIDGVTALYGEPPPPSVIQGIDPVDGLWTITAEENGRPGRGFQVVLQGDTLVLTFYGYDPDGGPNWWLASGTFGPSSNQISMSLQAYTDGTTFGGVFQDAVSAGSPGQVTIRFDTDSSGIICLPDEACKNINHFVFAE